jgi:catechol 2,3-dioxygenase
MNTLQTGTPAHLNYLHITSEQPDRLAGFYETQFSLERSMVDGQHVLRGGARALIISEGPSAKLLYAAYAVNDDSALAGLRQRLTARSVELEALSSPLYKDGSFTVTDPDGRKMAFGVASAARQADREPARLQHTVFQTTQLESVIRFYVDKVGFTVSDEVVNDAGEIMTVFLRSDDEHHTLAFFRGSKSEWDHHCYETSEWNDIRDWGDKFAKQRIPIFFGPGRHGPGNNLFFMVTDPDGNRLEFSAELQRVAHDLAPGVWPHEEYTLNSWGRAWIRT